MGKININISTDTPVKLIFHIDNDLPYVIFFFIRSSVGYVTSGYIGEKGLEWKKLYHSRSINVWECYLADQNYTEFLSFKVHGSFVGLYLLISPNSGSFGILAVIFLVLPFVCNHQSDSSSSKAVCLLNVFPIFDWIPFEDSTSSDTYSLSYWSDPLPSILLTLPMLTSLGFLLSSKQFYWLD